MWLVVGAGASATTRFVPQWRRPHSLHISARSVNPVAKETVAVIIPSPSRGSGAAAEVRELAGVTQRQPGHRHPASAPAGTVLGAGNRNDMGQMVGGEASCNLALALESFMGVVTPGSIRLLGTYLAPALCASLSEGTAQPRQDLHSHLGIGTCGLAGPGAQGDGPPPLLGSHPALSAAVTAASHGCAWLTKASDSGAGRALPPAAHVVTLTTPPTTPLERRKRRHGEATSAAQGHSLAKSVPGHCRMEAARLPCGSICVRMCVHTNYRATKAVGHGSDATHMPLPGPADTAVRRALHCFGAGGDRAGSRKRKQEIHAPLQRQHRPSLVATVRHLGLNSVLAQLLALECGDTAVCVPRPVLRGTLTGDPNLDPDPWAARGVTQAGDHGREAMSQTARVTLEVPPCEARVDPTQPPPQSVNACRSALGQDDPGTVLASREAWSAEAGVVTSRYPHWLPTSPLTPEPLQRTPGCRDPLVPMPKTQGGQGATETGVGGRGALQAADPRAPGLPQPRRACTLDSKTHAASLTGCGTWRLLQMFQGQALSFQLVCSHSSALDQKPAAPGRGRAAWELTTPVPSEPPRPRTLQDLGSVDIYPAASPSHRHSCSPADLFTVDGKPGLCPVITAAAAQVSGSGSSLTWAGADAGHPHVPPSRPRGSALSASSV
ncbi:hypothetical protein H920_06723 [Fukomys damarensis]|uniref:Uncharacterized protein n=1 Tax=Fukomys damarensis TaxID=885580 RepID=A0A091DL74_FUKDA|nr:hypothetical protein H920_06723 [Fukomys damarensis]